MTPLAEKIKAANDKTARLKPMDVWGVTVYLKSWSGKEREDFLAMVRSIAAKEQNEKMSDNDLHIEVCLRGMVDEHGELIFNGDGKFILKDKDASMVEIIFDAILDHNALGKDARERAAKNSMSSQSSDSGTSSLAT